MRDTLERIASITNEPPLTSITSISPDISNAPTPFGLSLSQTAPYVTLAERRDVANRFALIIGDSLDDFCLFYSLRRVGHPAAWLPAAWVHELAGSNANSDLRPLVHGIARLAPSDLRRTVGLKISSFSLQPADLADLQDTLRRYTGLGMNFEFVKPTKPVDLCAEIGIGINPYCVGSMHHHEIYPFVDDTSVGPVRTPMPSGFTQLRATKHRWIVEVRHTNSSVPSLPHIADHLILNGDGPEGKRITRGGLAYYCPPRAELILSDEVTPSLYGSKVRLFDPMSAASWISTTQKVSCELSDKGLYQRDATSRFGGLPEVANMFRNVQSRKLLAKYRDHHSPGHGVYDEGCVIAKRRYLDHVAAAKAMGQSDSVAVATCLDRLTAAKVLYRGYALGCSTCKHLDWYGLGQLTDSFQCHRCGREQVISLVNWRYPHSPQVFYKLDEIVFQFLNHDGDVTALALDYLRRNSSLPFSYSPEIRFKVPRSHPDVADDSGRGAVEYKSVEVDICAAWNGSFAVGEAKNKGSLGESKSETSQELEKYVRLGRMLHAHFVVFATLDAEWREDTVAAARNRFKDEMSSLIFLTREHLLGDN